MTMPVSRRSTKCAFLPLAERQRPIVDAVQLQQIEGVQHGLSDRATAVERVEDGDARPKPLTASAIAASPIDAASLRRAVYFR
jgi:hypothetical protein